MLERIHPEIPDDWYESTTQESKAIGFDDTLFYGHFTREGNTFILHSIFSREPGEGNVQKFLQHLIDENWNIIIVKPNETMQHICEKLGFVEDEVMVEGYYSGAKVECWRRK
jgi:hypothetical protein